MLKRTLLLSFVSVLCLSQDSCEDHKKANSPFINLTTTSSENAKEKFNNSTPTSISDKLSVNQNTLSHVKSNSKNAEPKTADKDYLTEIKDGLNKIFDLCLIIGGIALIFITLKILYSLSKYLDSLTIIYARKKPANLKQKDE